jgi:intraflagellar transport protein 172
VLVKRIENGQRIVLKSANGYEISKINIYQDRFLVA